MAVDSIRAAPVTLDSARVRMEPLSLERHFAGLCEIGLDPELWRWTTNRVGTREDLRVYLETALREQAEGRSLPFATADKPSGRIAGSTSLNRWNRARCCPRRRSSRRGCPANRTRRRESVVS